MLEQEIEIERKRDGTSQFAYFWSQETEFNVSSKGFSTIPYWKHLLVMTVNQNQAADEILGTHPAAPVALNTDFFVASQ